MILLPLWENYICTQKKMHVSVVKIWNSYLNKRVIESLAEDEHYIKIKRGWRTGSKTGIKTGRNKGCHNGRKTWQQLGSQKRI